jgi:hypothetical protein
VNVPSLERDPLHRPHRLQPADVAAELHTGGLEVDSRLHTWFLVRDVHDEVPMIDREQVEREVRPAADAIDSKSVKASAATTPVGRLMAATAASRSTLTDDIPR